jgi:hypothetical protein
VTGVVTRWLSIFTETKSPLLAEAVQKTRIEFFAVGPHFSERIQTAAEVEILLSLVPK